MELLQSQGEVRRLLDRVTEAERDKAEMVSSKVHTQLLQIADDRAMAAETRAQKLENEVSEQINTINLVGHLYSLVLTGPKLSGHFRNLL